MTQLLLTGGAGFIGGHFLNDYAHKFDRVIVPTRREFVSAKPNVEIIPTDGTVFSMVNIVKYSQPNVIINCAASGIKPTDRNWNTLRETNIDLPVALFSTAQSLGCNTFIQLSSMAEYSPPPTNRPLKETDNLGAQNFYGQSKISSSRLLDKLFSDGSTNLITLRLFGVFGPGESSHRLTTHIREKIGSGKEVPLSIGTQIRDFIYIKDVTEAIYIATKKALQIKGFNHVFNIGSGYGLSVKDFVMAFCDAGNLDTNQLNFGALPLRDTDIPYLVANIIKAETFLAWKPRWTLDKALLDYFET